MGEKEWPEYKQVVSTFVFRDRTIKETYISCASLTPIYAGFDPLKMKHFWFFWSDVMRQKMGWLMLLLGFLAHGLACAEACKAEEAFVWAIEPRFDEAKDFAANGLAAVEAGNKLGYVNERGEEVIPLRFVRARDFAANGLAAVMVWGKGWGYINERGEEVIAPQFMYAGDFAANGLAMVKVEDNGHINERSGEALLNRPPGIWGYINERGEEVIAPRFDHAENFTANGLARVRVKGKFGYINERGEEVIAPR
jgi:hypothetical protein